MNKSDLVRAVSVKSDIPFSQAEVAVDNFFEAMTSGLADGRRVEIRGFGSFQVKEYAGYTGRNPKTGEAVEVAPKKLPVFKMGKELKNVINGK